MNDSHKRQMVIMYEGQALNYAGVNGDVEGINNAHCAIDGLMNALIRLDGPEEVAKFAFALSDRVVGKVCLPTVIRKPPQEIEHVKVTIVHEWPPIARAITVCACLVIAWLAAR